MNPLRSSQREVRLKTQRFRQKIRKKNNELQVQLQKFSEELDIHEYKKQYAIKENNETSADNRSKEPQQLTSH